MECPNCQTEISELKKIFPAKEFVGLVLIFGILTTIIIFIGTSIKVHTRPLIDPQTAYIFGIGFMVLIILLWMVGTFPLKPDRCPLCDAKIKFDDKTKSFVVK